MTHQAKSRILRRVTLGTILLLNAGAVAQEPAPQSEEFEQDDTTELLGWTIRGEIKAEVRNGKLILDGQGGVAKQVRVDLDRYPVLSAGISHADKLYNFGYLIQGEPRAGLPQWPPDHPALVRFKALRCSSLEEFRGWVADEVKNTD